MASNCRSAAKLLALPELAGNKDLQRKLRIKAAFKKIKPAKEASESTSKQQPDPCPNFTNFGSDVTRFDIVELSCNGSSKGTLKESVIVHSPAVYQQEEAAMLEPVVEIKEEPMDVSIKREEEIPELLPTDFLKIEHNENLEKASKPLDGPTRNKLKLLPRKKRKSRRSSEGDYWTREKSYGGRLVCKICDKRFSYYRCYRQHQLFHQHKDNMVQCRICQKWLKPPAFTYHFTYKHSEARNFQCRFCGVRFKSPNSMLNHIRMKHKDAKEYDDNFKFECKKCQRFFEHENHLDEHIKLYHSKLHFSITNKFLKFDYKFF